MTRDVYATADVYSARVIHAPMENRAWPVAIWLVREITMLAFFYCVLWMIILHANPHTHTVRPGQPSTSRCPDKPGNLPLV